MDRYRVTMPITHDELDKELLVLSKLDVRRAELEKQSRELAAERTLHAQRVKRLQTALKNTPRPFKLSEVKRLTLREEAKAMGDEEVPDFLKKR